MAETAYRRRSWPHIFCVGLPLWALAVFLWLLAVYRGGAARGPRPGRPLTRTP